MSAQITRCCDLVMKGGITSGVVYPAAVHEIAERFFLVGIGGTSAGAIAASLAAAAEYRRRHTGTLDGFAELEAIAKELTGEGKLLELFRPDWETRKLFGKLVKILDGSAGLGTKLSLGAGFMFWRKRMLRRVVDNGFGLTTGMANGNRADGEMPLCEWLAAKIDAVAGKTGDPLTFADLHGAPVPGGIAGVLQAPPGRSIDFRSVATCLTFGRPLEFPLREEIFAFDPDEWARLFPRRVVEYLVREAGQIDSPSRTAEGKLPLPGDRLPIVAAARMSLSFPGLFTMVPLWARNYHVEGDPLQRVWLSDGGITSNFPVHRFDSLYPQWPTLAVNLQYEEKEGAGPQRRTPDPAHPWVYLPQRRQDGVLDLWSHFDNSETAMGALSGFIKAIFESAKAWHDNAYLKLPGFRDRMAEVWMSQGEGGMNLGMDPATLDRLVERGRVAGKLVAERFAATPKDDPMSWDGHRWVRYRSAFAGLMEALQIFRESVESPMDGDRSLLELLAANDAPPTHRFPSNRQREAAETVTRELLELARRARDLPTCNAAEDEPERPFCKGPRPRVDIGTRPQF